MNQKETKKKTRRIFFNKTLWSDRSIAPWKFYCPLCGVERRVSMRPDPSASHFFQIGLLSVVFTLAAWPFFQLKGLVSFIPFWIVFEVVYRLKIRATLPCSQCGFDPYLYLDNPERAKQEIESYWRKKFEEKGIPYPEKNPSHQTPSLTDDPPQS